MKSESTTPSFENQLFKISEKLRGNIEYSDYKHIVLGLIFLKYISDSNCFLIRDNAKWSYLKDNAKEPKIGTLIDNAMLSIEENNESLKDILLKDYERSEINQQSLGELILLISKIENDSKESKDILGRVYEYFLGQFAGAEGKLGGEFYTPCSVVQLLVEMLQSFHGRIYDPTCGSGGMFMHSNKTHTGNITFYGQELNRLTWRLAKMNLAMHNMNSDIRWNNEGTLLNDEFPNMEMDYILANPPFNISNWKGERLREDVRWKYGTPPVSNANFAWLQHVIHHLAPNGSAGVVLANGSMSSAQSDEDVIRREMVEQDVVDCMVALPGQLFYSTQIPVCLWFLTRNKNPGNGWRDRRGEVLFIDARKLGVMVDRTRKKLTDEDVARIAGTYHAWRGEKDAGTYQDVPGFCCSVKISDIAKHGHVLIPGRYVGVEDVEDTDEDFNTLMLKLTKQLSEQMAKGTELDEVIRQKLGGLGYGI
jgi:type I restriction enzyme M protein